MSHLLGSVEGIGDRDGIVALLPAVSFNVTTTFTLSSGVHHNYAVAVPKHEFRVTGISGAVVCDPVKENHPIAIRFRRLDFPSAQLGAVRCFHNEVRL